MKRLFKQFCFPGGIPSHVAPETPGLDPRGRRARLCAVARLRRGLRQPRPDRRLRGRRRRGRDRPARHELALEQVPQPGPRRRGPADPPPERLQDRQPAASWRASPRTSSGSSSRATGTRRTSSRGTSPSRCTRRWPPRWTRCVAEIKRIQARRPGERVPAAGRAWPMIVLRTPKGWTCPTEIDGKKCEGYWRSHQVPMGDMATDRARPHPRRLDEVLPARGAVRRRRAAPPRAGRAGPDRRPADGGQPARQRRPPAPGPAHARLPRLRGGRAGARRR